MLPLNRKPPGSTDASPDIARSHQRRGLGSRLLERLVKDCIAAGKRQMVAIIGGSGNQGSGFASMYCLQPFK